MKEKSNVPKTKKQIYFARTYRHLRFNRLECALFLLLFVLPATIALLFYYDELTWMMSAAAQWLLQKTQGMQAEFLTSEFIPGLGPVHYLSIPTVLPEYGFILANLAVALVLVWALSTGPQKGRPMAIYLSIVLLVHTMACVFFLLGRDLFPYTITEYADLYVKQQVGIWITFLVLIGIVMGILGRGAVIQRIVTVLCVMVYSVLFGVVRYALFLWILTRFSVLYIPVMFFALGPFFDFLYFVMIYAISTNRIIRKYETERRGEWVWA